MTTDTLYLRIDDGLKGVLVEIAKTEDKKISAVVSGLLTKGLEANNTRILLEQTEAEKSELIRSKAELKALFLRCLSGELFDKNGHMIFPNELKKKIEGGF